MAEILIKNMEMPKSCETCQLATVNYYNTWCPLTKCFMKKGYSFKDCPLVELPPHGRLIDADKLFNECEQFDLPNVMPDSLWFEANDLLNAPTVLKASKERE